MFGYFRFNADGATPEMKKVYKNYYCGTCFALEKNYGEVARLLLSYDVVIMGLLAKSHQNGCGDRLPCFGKRNNKTQFSDETWKKIAAINILLFSVKIDDDIHDEQSKKAKAAGVALKGVIKKARKDFPMFAELLDEGYRKMASLEEDRVDVRQICYVFSGMMSELMKIAFNMDEIGVVTSV